MGEKSQYGELPPPSDVESFTRRGICGHGLKDMQALLHFIKDTHRRQDVDTHGWYAASDECRQDLETCRRVAKEELTRVVREGDSWSATERGEEERRPEVRRRRAEWVLEYVHSDGETSTEEILFK